MSRHDTISAQTDTTVRLVGTAVESLAETLRHQLSGVAIVTEQTWLDSGRAPGNDDCIVVTDGWRRVLTDRDLADVPVLVVTSADTDPAAVLTAGATDVISESTATGEVLVRRLELLFGGTYAPDRTLTALHRATRNLFGARDRSDVAQILVGAASGVLRFSGAGVRFYDPEKKALVCATFGGEEASDIDGRPPFDVEGTPHGRAFRTGETVVHRVADPDPYDLGPFERTMYVPLGEYGVLSVGRRQAADFDETDVHYAEILAESGRAALDRVERERELREQKQRLETFADVVSHDLRTPLQLAQGRLELARDECSSHHLDEVDDAHGQMERLVENMLTLARSGDPDRESGVDITTLAREAWDAVGTESASLRIEAETGTVSSAPDQLRQLFSNLFRNALEHAGPNVTVTVGTTDDSFFVADDGPGIPETERDRILDHGYTTDPDSTGFGLAIVHRIARAHGWSVEVTESEAGGARFEFLL